MNPFLPWVSKEPKIVSIFQLVFLMVKFHSKFNFSCTLGLKLSNSNPPHHHHHHHHGGFFPTIPKACPSSPIIFLFSLQWVSNGKIIQYSITSPLYVCSSTLWIQFNALSIIIKGFSMVPKVWEEVPWFGRSQFD